MTALRGHEARLALRATGLLADFNRAGILTAADVHVAQRLGRLGGETDEAVLLAVALVVRSTRHGSVVLDLSTAEATTSPEVDEESAEPEATVDLEWPDGWVERCAASPLVGAPVRMSGSRLWLARYWDQEEQVAAELRERSAAAQDDLDAEVLLAGLDRLFPRKQDHDQRSAAQVCALSRVSVLAGGPGTGKTTTVSRLLALLKEQQPEWRVRLAAPTGKAAARLEEAVRSSTASLPAPDRERVGEPPATTLHRLLGWRPEARSRFRHDRTNRLPAEVVVVDEASMVSLTMMARLLEALRPSTRLVLVGDPDQLASVEAGAVLGDLADASSGVAVAALSTNRRFPETSGIARLAAAVQEGRGEDALAVLAAAEAPEVELVAVADDSGLSGLSGLSNEQLGDVREDVVRSGTALHEAAEAGDARAALAALDAHRLLCAHRRGPRGVTHWSALAERWVADVHPVVPRADGRYAGEPLLVTANDYEIELFNGDTGVVVADGHGGLVAVFGRGGDPIEVPLVRLGAVRPLHAMTVHRSQGSQFARITVVLPPAGSPLGTRETLYTAVTRATTHVRVVGSPEALVEAVGRPAARATGLRERLSSPRRG